MASGELTATRAVDAELLPFGTGVTTSGRISAARIPGDEPTTPPFIADELAALDDELSHATERALVRFSVYIGDLGEDAAAGAAHVLAQAPEAEHACLIAVSPGSRDIAIVSGIKVADRITDRVAQLGITAAVAEFKSGELLDGIIAALRVVSTAAAPA